MTAGIRLVGIEELSAGVLRGRLLDRAGEFWAGAVEDAADTPPAGTTRSPSTSWAASDGHACPGSDRSVVTAHLGG